MNYVGKLLSNFKGFYNEINSATLTGAIDILIIRQEDGSFISSPWHVRFGKMGVLRAKEKVVDIEINNEVVEGLHMKLGDAGEAFFVQQAEAEEEEFPEYLATSPLPTNLDLMEKGLEEMKRQVAKQEQEEEEVAVNSSRVRRTSVHAQTDICQEDIVASSASVTPVVGAIVMFPPTTIAGETGTTATDSLYVAGHMERDESRTSIYYSVDIPDEELSGVVTPDVEIGGGFGNKKSLGIQTDMAGEQVELIQKTRATSIDRTSVSSSGSAKVAENQEKNSEATESSKVVADATDIKNTDHKEDKMEKIAFNGAVSTRSQKKRGKRKRQDHRLLSETSNSSVGKGSIGSAVSDKPVDDDHEEGCMFEMEVEDEADGTTEATTVMSVGSGVPNSMSLPLLDAQALRCEEWAQSHVTDSSYNHPFSDGDLTPIVSPIGSRPPSPKSDTELDVQKEAMSQTALTGDDMHTLHDEFRWEWGEIPQRSTPITPTTDSAGTIDTAAVTDKPSTGLFKFMRSTKKLRHQPEQGGIYLDDLNLEQMDPEVAALYIYHPANKHRLLSSQKRDGEAHPAAIKSVAVPSSLKDEDDAESGRGASLPQSPQPGSSHHQHDTFTPLTQNLLSMEIDMSLCGGLEGSDSGIPRDKFTQYLVTYEQFCENPNLMNDPNLVIRIADKYYNWQVAGPIIMATAVFHRPLTESAINSLIKQHIPKKQRRRGWLWWGRETEVDINMAAVATNTDAVKSGELLSLPSSASSSVPNSPQKKKEPRKEPRKKRERKLSSTPVTLNNEELSSGDESDTSEHSLPVIDSTMRKDKFKKSLKLSSHEIEKLNLQDGVNEVSFSVTTQYQGTSRCSAYIYLWNWDDKIIVSDIDGTITKSDVLGQVLPMIGKDWSQVGIANLYNLVANNGYRFIYLSARAIGQSKITRDYIRSIRQGELSLPDGPLLLSPASLISAFHKEVIERKPEEFKISCLRDITALFPPTRNPLYAGFGNKINDVWAYRAVGIPIARIFTVNPRGELKSEMISNFQSSYSRLSDVADHFFPPLVEKNADQGKIHAGNFTAPDEFSTFTYWRDPLPDLNLEDDALVLQAK